MSLFDGKAAEHRPAESLAELAAAIKGEHAAYATAMRQGLGHARQLGLFLVKAKALCRHGEWLPWLERHVSMTRQHAGRFMRVARNWPKCSDAKNLDEALRMLAEDAHEDGANGTEKFHLPEGRTDDGPDDDYQREAQERTYDEHRPAFQERNGGTWAPEAAPARGKGDPSKLTDEKVIEWAKEHVPQPEPPVVGPDVGGFVGELIGHAERLRDGLIALRGRCGKGTPDWLDVCVAIERLQRFQADCSWRGKGRG